MERTLADMEADIVSLRAHAAKYRRLAEERRAADHARIADKLMELVADIETQVAQLEAITKGQQGKTS